MINPILPLIHGHKHAVRWTPAALAFRVILAFKDTNL